jgi:predicted ATPase/DNA-binding CsgD family transcriptional regulator
MDRTRSGGPAERLTAWPGLPAQPTSLLGRGADLAAARALLDRAETRLLTLLGPGGTGKTRLGVALAAQAAPDFADGAAFVDLSAERDPAAVAGRIAKALGLRDTPGLTPSESLRAHLRERALLLVLDNFEQVVDGGVEVARLLASCPRVKAIVTSRQPLRVSWERVLRVQPLGLPEVGVADPDQLLRSPAVELFVERARDVRPDFGLCPENASAVAEICRRVDGLPLAVELAAAHSDVLAPAAILRRLEGRLDLLSDGPRDQPDRHRSLRSTIEWSHAMLGPAEQRLFQALAVFRGGCTAAAAAAVIAPGTASDDMLTQLTALVNRSLLTTRPTDDDEPRFVMLETIREYAAEHFERAQDAADLGRRHAAYVAALVGPAEAGLLGPEQAGWLRRLDREYDNLRAALRWAIDHDPRLGMRIGTATEKFFEIRGRLAEGRALMERLLAAPPTGDDRAERARLGWAVAHLTFLQADYPAARGQHERCLADARAVGDHRTACAALDGLGLVAMCLDDQEAARERFEQELALARATGDEAATATALNNLGRVLHFTGDLERARRLQEESLAIRRRLGDSWGQGIATSDLANVVLSQGRVAVARALQLDSLSIWVQLGSRWGSAYVFEGLAAVALASSAPERTVRLAGAAASLRAAIGGPISPVRARELDRTIEVAGRILGREQLEVALAEGRAMDLARAVAYAREPEPGGQAAGSSSPAVADDLLSPREREVAVLVARGLTNREIARTLVISERTVDVHVARILAKLEFSSRTQVAAWVVRQRSDVD